MKGSKRCPGGWERGEGSERSRDELGREGGRERDLLGLAGHRHTGNRRWAGTGSTGSNGSAGSTGSNGRTGSIWNTGSTKRASSPALGKGERVGLWLLYFRVCSKRKFGMFARSSSILIHFFWETLKPFCSLSLVAGTVPSSGHILGYTEPRFLQEEIWGLSTPRICPIPWERFSDFLKCSLLSCQDNKWIQQCRGAGGASP